jgi:signal transduction histidine kinase
MEVIERAAKRMNRLIQDLLDVALMEAGQLTIETSATICRWIDRRGGGYAETARSFVFS